jgi:CHAD domain-containing protein
MSTLTLDGGSELAPVVALLEARGVRLRAEERVTRSRLDTFDGRLHAAGLRLERRRGTSDDLVLTGRDGVPAHLALPAGEAATSGEITRVLRAEDLPPGPFRARLTAVARERVLLPQLTLTTRRQVGTRPGREGAPTVALGIDRWQSLEVGRYATRTADGWTIEAATLGGWTVEITALPGHPRPAADLTRRLTHRGLRCYEGDALDLALQRAGVAAEGWQGPARSTLDRRAPALHGYRTVLRALLDALEANWPGTVEHLDSEFLHQARIAVRRTRSVLTEGRGVLPPDVRREQRQVFAWLGRLTGPARDLDVYVEGWTTLTAPLSAEEASALDPVRDLLIGQRDADHRAVSEAMGSVGAASVLATWRAWLALADDGVEGGRRADQPLGKIAGARLTDAQQQVITDGRAIGPTSPPEALHELRKDAKRLRYLLESFGPLGGSQRVKDILSHLKLLQDNLGEFQDTQVQADRLRASAAEVAADGQLSPETDAAVERLARILEARGAAARDDFARCFADYDERRTRRTVAELIDRMSR